MRILVLGASGGCGRWVTRLALAGGHAVTALVRPVTPFEAPAGVAVQRGSVLDPADLARAVAGQDAVVSCLGAQRVNPRLPWSPVRPPLHLAEESAKRLAPRVVPRLRMVSTFSRADVAAWLARAATDPAPIADRTPMIGWR